MSTTYKLDSVGGRATIPRAYASVPNPKHGGHFARIAPSYGKSLPLKEPRSLGWNEPWMCETIGSRVN